MSFFKQSKRSELSYVEWMGNGESRSTLPWHTDDSYAPSLSANAYEDLIKVNPLARLISSETFFERLSHLGRVRSGLIWKFISLIPLPLLYAVGSYLLLAKLLGWWEVFSLSGAVLIFVVVFVEAFRRLRQRPSFLEVLKFMVEEVGVFWLLWMCGSMTYTYLHHHAGLVSFLSYFLAMIPVLLTYLLAAGHVRNQPAAETMFPYLAQLGWMVLTSALVFAVGFLATPLWWAQAVWPYDYYVGAVLVSLVWFWTALKLFFISSDSDQPPEIFERGSAIERS